MISSKGSSPAFKRIPGIYFSTDHGRSKWRRFPATAVAGILRNDFYRMGRKLIVAPGKLLEDLNRLFKTADFVALETSVEYPPVSGELSPPVNRFCLLPRWGRRY